MTARPAVPGDVGYGDEKGDVRAGESGLPDSDVAWVASPSVTPTLRTERLLLEPYIPEDEEGFVALFQDTCRSGWVTALLPKRQTEPCSGGSSRRSMRRTCSMSGLFVAMDS
ncbi:hypothetical protein GCM10027074_39630 [Streptomyces deserti]